LEYQDKEYAALYLERLNSIIELDRLNSGDRPGYPLSAEVARQLALQMCYEDTIRVAEIKTSGTRFEEVRRHLNVQTNQPAHVVEYLHPRLEEVCDTLPEGLGRMIMGSDRIKRLLAPLFKKGRTIATTSIFGFLLLASVARLKRWRTGTYRFAIQTQFITAWLDHIRTAVSDDYDYALSIAKCIGIVKGYGDTFDRGLSRYQKSVQVARGVPAAQRAEALRSLHQAALAGEDGALFSQSVMMWEGM